MLLGTSNESNRKDITVKTLLVLALSLMTAASSFAALADSNVTERDSDGQTALHKAAVYDWGSLDDVKKLIARGADVHAADNDGFTPLHLAAMSGYADKAKALLGAGAKYDAATKMGTLPLHLAAERRRINTELLELLIGPPTNRVVNVMNKEGHTPLFRAVDADNADTIKWLLEHGANPDLGKELPLERAFILNYTKCAEALCAGGANVNAIDRDGVTLLTKAIDREKKETIKFLLDHKADPNAKDKQNRTAIHMAASKGNQPVMETLLALKGDINAADEEGRTPLDYAGDSNAQWTEWLKSKGAKPGQPKPKPIEPPPAEEDDGNTPLHLVLYKNDLAALKQTIQANTKLLNQRNRDGETPLFKAVSLGWLEGAQALADAGADIQTVNETRRNLAHCAAGYGNIALLQWAVSKGVDSKATDNGGYTPLHRAAGNKTTDCVQFLLERGADVNAKSKTGEVPLYNAIRDERLDTIKLLLSKGGDVRVADTSGNTLLHQAARRKNPEVARLLLDKGADINAKNLTGVTALHRAAEYKTAIETLKLLLSKGADKSAKDKDGKTPLDYATKYKNDAAIQLLK
jgi:ankyrin repeat protein